MKHDLIQIMPKHGDHIWHVFMNKMNDARKPDGFDRTIYEFKGMIQWLEYGHEKIAQAFEGRLPSSHRQCSHVAPEPIPSNNLVCAIGKDVTECQILKDLRAVVDEQKAHYSGLDDAFLYRLMSMTCAWHILHKSTGMTNGWHGIDTSEGFMCDTSDRMFWSRVYESMAGPGPEEEQA